MKLNLPRFHRTATLLIFVTATISIQKTNGEVNPPTPLSTPADICGAELSSGGNFVITTALIDCDGIGDNGNGLILSGTSTLDCQFNTLSGGSSGVGLILRDSSTAVNCIILGYENGIVLDDSAGSRTLNNIEASENASHGVVITGAGDNALTEVTASRNGIHGFFISGSGTNMFTDLTANNNIYYGVQVAQFSGTNTFFRLISTANSQGVFMKRDVSGANIFNDSNMISNIFHGYVVHSKVDVTISGGMTRGNSRHGILATRYGATGTLLITNVVIDYNTKNGIVVAGSQDVTIEGSLINHNGQDGIYIRNVRATINCNQITDNIDNGVETLSDITLTNVLLYDNAGGNLNPDGKTVINTDYRVCTNSQDCDALDLSECSAFALLQPSTVLTSAAEVCGETLNDPRYVIPPGSVFYCGNGNGPRLLGTTVLDCKGATIKGNPSASRQAVYMRDTTTIRNCIFAEFHNGIVMENGYDGDKVVTDTMVINGNNRGFIISANGNHVITNVSIINNSGGGIDVNAVGDMTFTDVTSTDNSNYGFRFGGTHDGNVVIVDSVVSDNSNGITIQGSGTYSITDTAIERNTNYGIQQQIAGVASLPVLVSITNVAVRDNGRGILLREATSNVLGTVITGTTTGSGLTWRYGDVVLNCVEISGGAGRGIAAQSLTDYTGTVTINNSLIYQNNGSENIRSPNTVLGTVYACDGATSDDIRYVSGPPTNDFANVVCDDIQEGFTCGSSCMATSLADFEASIAAACTAYPLVG